MPDLPTVSPEIMGSLKTLGQIAEFLNNDSGGDTVGNRSHESNQLEKLAVTDKIPGLTDTRRKEIAETILEVVSRLTGYPEEMLGLDMDIEAELGIDSIKRVEILSTLEEKMPDLPTVSPEIMGSLKTLGQIAEFLSTSSSANVPLNPAAEEQPTILSPAVQHGPKSLENMEPDSPPPDMPEIPRNVITVVEAPVVFENPVKSDHWLYWWDRKGKHIGR